MSWLHHLWALLCHHACHEKPHVTGEQMASLTLYPPCRREVKAIPKEKP